MNDVWLLGVAMTNFGRYPGLDAADLGTKAALGALADANVPITDIGMLAVGNRTDLGGVVPGDGLGHRILRQIGQTGMPVYHLMSACASGASALRVIMMAIRAGEISMGLCVGTEHLSSGLGTPPIPDEAGIRRGLLRTTVNAEGLLGTYSMPGEFAHIGMEYAAKYDGVGFEQFARVAQKNHFHSTMNPQAQYQKEYSLAEIMGAEMITYPNTRLMCCPNSDGAAAAVLVTTERLRTLHLEQQRRAVLISSSVLASDPWVDTADGGFDLNTVTRQAADQAYEESGVGPDDLDLVELHDCFATAELVHYDNLRLCGPGEAGEFIDSGAPWRTGRTPVNVSGGLLSKGHPVGATAIAGIYEVATQLRGEAGPRQIEGASVGLTHVLGLGSTCAVHVLKRAAGSARD